MLLYRVVETGGGVTEQLVVTRPYVSEVLFMAHTHLLGAHLGMDKTRDRVLVLLAEGKEGRGTILPGVP